MCADIKPANSTTWRTLHAYTLHNIMSARPTTTNLVVEGRREVPFTSQANHLISFFKTKATRHPRAEVPRLPPRPTSMFRAITRQEPSDGSAMPRHVVRTTYTMKPLYTYRKWRGLRCFERLTGLSHAGVEARDNCSPAEAGKTCR